MNRSVDDARVPGFQGDGHRPSKPDPCAWFAVVWQVVVALGFMTGSSERVVADVITCMTSCMTGTCIATIGDKDQGVCVVGPVTTGPVSTDGYVNTTLDGYGHCDSNGENCWDWYEFRYYYPAGASTESPLPIYVFTDGTSVSEDWSNNGIATYPDVQLQQMAARGFFAVEPIYQSDPECDELPSPTCEEGDELHRTEGGLTNTPLSYARHAYQIFAPEAEEGLMGVLHPNPFIDFSRVVNSGVSQGGSLAVYAKLVNDNVLGSAPHGSGHRNLAFNDCLQTLVPGTGIFTDHMVQTGYGDHLRILNGEGEDRWSDTPECSAFGEIDPEVIAGQNNDMTELTCTPTLSGHQECLRLDGSGWIRIGHTKLLDGWAGHGEELLDSNWKGTEATWGGAAMYDWLACKGGMSGFACD